MTTDPQLLLNEVWYKATTSGGKGGQNVNKVATRVELYFNITLSTVLTAEEKALLIAKLQNKINDEGILRITSSEERSQGGNKERVQQKFIRLISRAMMVDKPRKKTAPGKAAKEERIKDKKILGERKKLRSDKPGLTD